MSLAPEIKGWCPGALRPMQSGDGLIVRIRPPGGRLTPAQAEAIARASSEHGNGILDLSARANLQLRGVTMAAHGPLIEDLRTQGLIDPDIDAESLRNLVVTPFRKARPGPLPTSDTTESLTAALTAALTRMPRLPAKFGFAVDSGPRPVLTTASADLRLERAADGRLILRPDGCGLGQPVTDLARDAIAMAEWFVSRGGVANGRGRMATLIASGILPEGCTTAPADPVPRPPPGRHVEGTLVALAFGQMQAETLAALAALGHEIRPTPGRMLFLAGAAHLPDLPGLITDPDDPLLRVTACTGAPGCPQALGETRALARTLAPLLPSRSDTAGQLHLSGCAKGCAHPGPAELTLVATARGYDLVRNGRASDPPALHGLSAGALFAHLKAPHAPSL